MPAKHEEADEEEFDGVPPVLKHITDQLLNHEWPGKGLTAAESFRVALAILGSLFCRRKWRHRGNARCHRDTGVCCARSHCSSPQGHAREHDQQRQQKRQNTVLHWLSSRNFKGLENQDLAESLVHYSREVNNFLSTLPAPLFCHKGGLCQAL